MVLGDLGCVTGNGVLLHLPPLTFSLTDDVQWLLEDNDVCATPDLAEASRDQGPQFCSRLI